LVTSVQVEQGQLPVIELHFQTVEFVMRV